jgi:3-methylcrotonyl-CoA carboxylase alpha subunit
MPTRVHLSGDGDWDAEVAGDQVTLDGKGGVVTVRRGEGAAITAESSDEQMHGVATVRGDAVWISIDGHAFELHARHGARRRASAADEDALSPPMSATVVRILVKPGATVAAGDVLIALEAMKMELGIRAPRAGTVTAIHCREGELVQPGTPLVTFA